MAQNYHTQNAWLNSVKSKITRLLWFCGPLVSQFWATADADFSPSTPRCKYAAKHQPFRGSAMDQSWPFRVIFGSSKISRNCGKCGASTSPRFLVPLLTRKKPKSPGKSGNQHQSPRLKLHFNIQQQQLTRTFGDTVVVELQHLHRQLQV